MKMSGLRRSRHNRPVGATASQGRLATPEKSLAHHHRGVRRSGSRRTHLQSPARAFDNRSECVAPSSEFFAVLKLVEDYIESVRDARRFLGDRRVIGQHEFGGAGLTIETKATAPRVPICCDRAVSEPHTDAMETFKPDAHSVLPSKLQAALLFLWASLRRIQSRSFHQGQFPPAPQ